ncbi:MAG: hypothetical protein C5B51_30115 [Terriglobia bacterium]|nr:MAG: hypothetical protein C5B51_30115 [Terriglobia bacterium]
MVSNHAFALRQLPNLLFVWSRTLLKLIDSSDKSLMRLQKHKALARVVWIAGTMASLVPGYAASAGNVIAIAGEASDIALDEPRGLLYIANFTAGRIDVMSLADNTIHSSLHVAPAPSSLALSPDGRYLVATHFGNVQPPGSPSNAISIVDRVSNGRQTFALGDPPLGVAFGADGLALIATTTQFLLLDPASGRTDFVSTVANVTANSIPAAPGTPPVQIVAAALAASADGRFIFGLADTIRFRYDVASRQVSVTGYTATPALGPRVVSAAKDGSYWAAGWAMFSRTGVLLAQFPNAAGLLAVGSHAIDSAAGTIYAQIPDANAAPGAPPVLYISDADNLTVREKLQLPENLAGRAVLDKTGSTLYAVSDSGVLVLPVGSLNRMHRLTADREDLLFRGNFCQRGAITKSFQIVDPGGGQTDFALTTDLAGVTITPSSGRTPATVRVQIDPSVFQGSRGTASGLLSISSSEAVNLPDPVRLLVNNQRPDERGSATDVPGTLVDLLADPVRDRFYVLRQDRNQLLVFDGSSMAPVATLRTGNTPTRMAITFDRKFLLVGHDNSQIASVYDLDTLTPLAPVAFPHGHYPRSIASSGGSILASSRVAGGPNTIDRIDLASRTASTLPTLGVFQNSIHLDTVLAATPNGASILAASADGTVMLYDAGTDLFTVSRKIGTTLAGAYATSNDGWYAAGNSLLNASLVPVTTWNGAEFLAGFAFIDGQGLRVTGSQAPAPASASLARVDLTTGSQLRSTRLAELPLTSAVSSVFTRAVAPLSNRQAMVVLTTSGFTAVAWSFDAAVVPPSIARVANAASLSSLVAPGSLISVFGANLNPTNIATSEIPLPTAIGQSCLTVNGAAIPMLFASPSQINAQLPIHLEGRATMTLYTPGGASDDYYLNIQSVAPGIFQSGAAGSLSGIPVVVKASNQELVTPSNPIHSGDIISIYATGLGATSPEVDSGLPAPAAPLAIAVVAPEVRLGGMPLAVNYAGLAPGEVGIYQINAQAPGKPPVGNQVPLTVTQSGVSTSVNVRVID